MKKETTNKDLYNIKDIHPITIQEMPLVKKYVNGEPVFSDAPIKVYAISEATSNNEKN